MEAKLRSKPRGQGHWERKCKNRFSRINSSKADRFTSNRDQNDQRPILHISSFVEYILPAYAQYTPPTPTRLNCRVESRRQCVLNSQLVGDSRDESEPFADNEVELRRVGSVNAPVVSRDPVSNFLRQSHS